MIRNILIVVVFLLSGLAGVLLLPELKFSFNFEQFFPRNDKELDFYSQFTKDFETDDNALLVAIERNHGVFDSAFLNRVHDFTLRAQQLPHIQESQSLTKLSYPVSTIFAVTMVPVIHLDDPSRLSSDSVRIFSDERFKGNLISADGKAMVVFLKTEPGITLDHANQLITQLNALLKQYSFEQTRLLGRANFQKELVELTQKEVALSTLIAGILVSLVIVFIFRRFWGSFIALGAILLGLVVFLGVLAVFKREITVLGSLYPVLMLILGTFDVIHVMSKYIDERRKGLDANAASRKTIKDMSLPTFLTYTTTAIGFLTLVGNFILPIADFGINATIGVTIAYLIAILFVPACLSFFELDQIVKISENSGKWEKAIHNFHFFTRRHPRYIAVISVIVMAASLFGISKITTNYRIEDNLPRGAKVTADFLYFEKTFAGFRPVEYVINPQEPYTSNDFKVLSEMNKLENHLRTYPGVRSVNSMTTIYKSLNQMINGGSPSAYSFPENDTIFSNLSQYSRMIPAGSVSILKSADGKKLRISTRMNDMGADSIKLAGQKIDNWIATNLDSNVITVKRTGTGMLVDRNGEYVRDNTIISLFWSVLIISLLMAFIFREWRVMLIFLIPNLFPLFICGGFMGYFGIQLEAGVSIVFSVIFGIAVDDTIHTLSKLKMFRSKSKDTDEALYQTMMEVGKPMIHTAIILFFGFMVMLFSSNPPSQNVGILMSFTLASALLSDLFLLPVLTRWLLK